MTLQDLIAPAVLSEVDRCYLCKSALIGKRHITVNFKKDVGKFMLEYFVVCPLCAQTRAFQVMCLGKGNVQFPQPVLN